MLRIITKRKNQLSNNEIYKICKLKESYWKYGIKSQLSWFDKNVKKTDYNNMIFFNNNLIGYTLMRVDNLIKKKNYNKKTLLIDSVIVKKNLRKKGISKILMQYNNYIINQLKLEAVLMCKKNLLNFYKIFKWGRIKKKMYNINKDVKKNFVILRYNN